MSLPVGFQRARDIAKSGDVVICCQNASFHRDTDGKRRQMPGGCPALIAEPEHELGDGVQPTSKVDTQGVLFGFRLDFASCASGHNTSGWRMSLCAPAKGFWLAHMTELASRL